jgi:hypothetical protein
MIKTNSRVFQVTPDDDSSDMVEIRERSLTLVQTTSLLLGACLPGDIARVAESLIDHMFHLCPGIQHSRIRRARHPRFPLVVQYLGNGWWSDNHLDCRWNHSVHLAYPLEVLYGSSSDSVSVVRAPLKWEIVQLMQTHFDVNRDIADVAYTLCGGSRVAWTAA